MSQGSTLRGVTGSHKLVISFQVGLAMLVNGESVGCNCTPLGSGPQVPLVLTKEHAHEYLVCALHSRDVCPCTWGHREVQHAVGCCILGGRQFPPETLFGASLEPSAVRVASRSVLQPQSIPDTVCVLREPGLESLPGS